MPPPLRRSLDFMPSPDAGRPGLLVRDPFHYSDATLLIPPGLVGALEFFDGTRTHLDLREYLVRLTGELDVSGLASHLEETLSRAGFLDDEIYARMKQDAERAFAESPARLPAHAGSGYPDDPEELAATLAEYLDGAAAPKARVSAIVAPHVSPFGGVESYRAAYSALPRDAADRTFIILGTSHYGEPDRLGLTRKPFVTPFGEAVTDVTLVDRLAAAAGSGAFMEDYCHAIEHSIEFQVIFLQHLFGPRVRIVPVLCGSFARSLYGSGKPEDYEPVRRALGALGELAAGDRDLIWVLGVDMAHMGRRYGDPMEAHAGHDEMTEVEHRDRARIECMVRGDAPGFWDLVRENQDDLKWCGSAPIYTFLSAVPGARGKLLHYQQWNIDPESVVSFAGLQFA